MNFFYTTFLPPQQCLFPPPPVPLVVQVTTHYALPPLLHPYFCRGDR